MPKKKTMKTTSQKKSNRLPQESKLVVPQAQTPETPQPERVDTRLPINSEARKQNRTLPTEKVLTLLQQHDRRLWELAEVVGKWIAETNDIQLVALESGNSPAVIQREYLEITTPQEAAKWFGIFPQKRP